MVIDIHTHIAFSKLYPKDYLVGMLEDEKLSVPKIKILAILKLFMNDRACQKVIRQMDESGISHAVLLIIDGELGMGAPELSLEEIFELHHEVSNRFPGRFSVFGGVDPRRGEAGFNLFKKAVEQYDFRGLKLYPPMGFDLSHRMLDSYYSICAERGLPVLIHTGPSQSSMKNEYSSPRKVGETAKRHPKTNFIMAHAGFRLNSEEYRPLLDLPNVYYDIAGFQAVYTDVSEAMVSNFGLIFDEPYSEKVLFGSDWPLFYMAKPLNTCLDLFMKFSEHVGNKSNDAVERILYRNAEHLLGFKRG